MKPSKSFVVASLLAVTLGAVACAGVKSGATTSGGGSGNGGSSGGSTGTGGSLGSGRGGSGVTSGSGGAGGSLNCDRDLRAVVRDFKGQVTTAGEVKHPDFEIQQIGDDHGIVADTLGADSKPVYAPGDTGMSPTTNGKMYFDQWYNDVDGVNLRFEITLPLTPDPTRPGVFVYDDDTFFPIDGMGFGNQYQSNNFDFTTELHFNFPYRGGEIFTFDGDDDLFLFVNGKKVIDLGGVHIAEMKTVDLDALAADLGLVKDGMYRMDLFHAERHLSDSHFHLETTLSCIDNIVIP